MPLSIAADSPTLGGVRILGKTLLALLAAWWLVMFAVYAIAGEWFRAIWFLALEAALVGVVAWRTRFA